MDVKDNPFIIENLKNDTGFLMLQTARLWDEYHERAIKKYYNITYIQYAVLASVYWLVLHGKREVTQTILAKYTKMDPMTISQVFKVLEKRGYIYRKTHSTDVRAKSVYFTPQGEELISKAVATVVNIDNKFFRILGDNIEHFNAYLLALLNENDL
ncbi:MAG: MarR family transcriptional regulator [Dysgonamonadaceae bacterium]|jgi:DNA-binding MarR family transcriptional regulator|nr:MarR family transcriptional regulator [Dysgonamonadaceae bacterium]